MTAACVFVSLILLVALVLTVYAMKDPDLFLQFSIEPVVDYGWMYYVMSPGVGVR